MKRLTQIFQVLLGVVALILTALIATGRLAWRTICNLWKNRAMWLRRTIATTFILVPVGFGVLVGYAFYKNKYGRDYWDRKLSEDVTLRSFSDNKWRVYNRQTGQYTTEKINWLSEAPDNDSLVVYALPNKRGYINVMNGEIVIDAKMNDYRKAWVFSEGLAAVVNNDKIGFINANNEVVIPFQFDYTDKCRMCDLGYVFHNGYCVMTNANGDLGLIDTLGRWVVEPTYDEVWSPHNNGYRIIIKDGKYGVLDSKCNIVYPAEYEYVDLLSEGIVLTNEGKKWQVDFDGNIVCPFMFDGTYYINYPIGYDECENIQYAFADYAKYEILNLYGIMNRLTGEPITLAIYSDVNMLSKELFEVQNPESYDWYLVDARGNIVSKSNVRNL